MKHTLLAAAFALGATVAVAQSPAPATPLPDVPKVKCEPKPEFPGRNASPNQRRNFDKELKDFGECTKAYVDERQAAARANQTAAQAAIDEYNAIISQINKDREAAANR
jgi:Spy/CpxP family protein refolding chaperone